LWSGEQFYWVINRSMDMIVGTEYYSKRGWAPNGDFRYKGPGLDHLIVRWNALLDRGVEEPITSPPNFPSSPGRFRTLAPNPRSRSGTAWNWSTRAAWMWPRMGRKDIPRTRASPAIVEFLSSYVYRLVFNDNYSQAISSEVASDSRSPTRTSGFIPSVSLDRFQTFASSTNGDEARIMHLPNLRYDVLDRPLGGSPLYWGLGSSLDYLSRSEPHFHARNVGRVRLLPASLAAAFRRRLELGSRGRFARHLLHRQPDPDLTARAAARPPSATTALNRPTLRPARHSPPGA
jgi:LPS-assembly protein